LKPAYKYARYISPKYRARRGVGGTLAAIVGSAFAVLAAVKIFPSARRYLRMKRM